MHESIFLSIVKTNHNGKRYTRKREKKKKFFDKEIRIIHMDMVNCKLNDDTKTRMKRKFTLKILCVNEKCQVFE